MTWLKNRKDWLPKHENAQTIPQETESPIVAIDVPNKPLFRLDEVAALVGVSRSTVYRWIDEGLLKVTTIVKSKRVTRHDLLACLQKKVS